MKNTLLAVALLTTIALNGQYYYNDILGAKEAAKKMATFQAARVRSVTATGYDPRGAETRDFNEWQEVQGSTLKVATRNGQSASRTWYSFDANGRLASTRDSSADIQSTSEYQYNPQGQISSIRFSTRDAGQDFNETEEHQWKYNAAGRPEKMLRILNGADSIEYLLTPDENGNIGEEQPSRRTVGVDPVYYYYDDRGRLTDIVRYDKHVKQLLPDVMFEYDDRDQVIQRRTTLSTRPPDYLIWRYLYNEQGLKTKEALFSKAKELKGRIEYHYEFQP